MDKIVVQDINFNDVNDITTIPIGFSGVDAKAYLAELNTIFIVPTVHTSGNETSIRASSADPV